MENVDLPLFIANVEGGVEWINPAGVRTLGFDATELNSLPGWVCGAPLPAGREIFNALAEGRGWSGPVRINARNGPRVLLATMSPMCEIDGVAGRCLVV